MKTKVFLLILILFLFSNTKVYAAVTIDFIPDSSSPSQEGYSGPLTDESNCSAVIPKPPNICSNGPAVNQTTCSGESPCTGGDTWSKYSLSGCYRDDSRIDQYAWIFLYSTLVCSTGDKCVAGETSLRPGFCSCDYGSSPNKYCCTSTGNSEACIQAGTQDTSYPPEGQCPGGYIVDGSRVRSSECVPIVTPPPTIAPTPTPIPTPTPTPTPTPITPCPGSGVSSSGWGGACSPLGSQSKLKCGTTCGSTCSVASCQTYAPNVLCWFNSGTCYNDPAACASVNPCTGGGVCTPNAKETICYPNESTKTCNR